MTVAELIKELSEFDPNKEVVVVGCSWSGCNEPERFDAEPFITEEEKKVVLQA
jgi:hypothetical protein